MLLAKISILCILDVKCILIIKIYVFEKCQNLMKIYVFLKNFKNVYTRQQHTQMWIHRTQACQNFAQNREIRPYNKVPTRIVHLIVRILDSAPCFSKPPPKSKIPLKSPNFDLQVIFLLRFGGSENVDKGPTRRPLASSRISQKWHSPSTTREIQNAPIRTKTSCPLKQRSARRMRVSDLRKSKKYRR